MPNFNTRKIYWDANGKPIYIALHTEQNADENSEGWWIKKIIWESGKPTGILKTVGKASKREELF